MNLGGALTALSTGRAPAAGVAGDATSEANPDAAEGLGFAALLELPSQPWASGWQVPDPAALAANPMGAGPAAGRPEAEASATEGDGEPLPPLTGTPARDPRLAHEAAKPLDVQPPAGRAASGTSLPASAAAAEVASAEAGRLSEPPPALPPGTVAPSTVPAPPLPGDKGPAAGDGSLAHPVPTADAADAARPQPDQDLPARTLALLDDALQRPVRLLAATPDPGAALQASQPTPELVATPALPAVPAPAPLPPRETLPGHLHLAAARTPDGDESAEQLNARLNWMANHQVGRAQIRLSPPHLGRVEIDLEIRDGKVRADFGAGNAEARALLEAGLPRLREMFTAQGLQLVHSEVSSSLSQGQGQNADAQARREPNPGEGQARTGRNAGPGDEAGDAAAEPAPVRLGRGLVDEFA